MNDLNTKTVIDFMVENIATIEIFKKYDINYSNSGNISLENLCHRHQLKYSEIIVELNTFKGKVPYLRNYNVWTIELLISFLVEIDHPYKKENIQFIDKLATKILSIHGEQLSEVQKLVTIIHKISKEIQNHIDFEEKNLFPYILLLNSPENYSQKAIITKPILVNILKHLENQHKSFSLLWKKINEKTNNYKLYEDIDNNFKLLLYKLRKFEEKLYNHIHIENNILFPKALELEKAFLNSRCI